jgi:hypothetical protein
MAIKLQKPRAFRLHSGGLTAYGKGGQRKLKKGSARRRISEQGPPVAPEILEEARRLVEAERVRAEPVKQAVKCVICGSEVAPNATEQLCWVCRRLKISAWADQDQTLTLPDQE